MNFIYTSSYGYDEDGLRRIFKYKFLFALVFVDCDVSRKANIWTEFVKALCQSIF